VIACGLALVLAAGRTPAREPHQVLAATTSQPSDLRRADGQVVSLERAGALVARRVARDALVDGRVHERLQQVHDGVPVFGGEVTRQSEGPLPVSLFGRLYQDLDVDTDAALSRSGARRRIEALGGTLLGPSREPDLLILPRPDGRFVLTWSARLFHEGRATTYFIDADTGALVWSLSGLQTQAAVGRGRGVLNDEKKVPATAMAGTFVARDSLHPPGISTFDLGGDVIRTERFLNGAVSLSEADLAAAPGNHWTDPAVVDAHVHVGWTYDYFFRRFGRRGLDDRNIPIRSVVHPVRRSDVLLQPSQVIATYYLNAFYAGDGVMVFGVGLPFGLTDVDGHNWEQLSGGLDVVAHELTHGVTDYSSGLIYEGEAGALNEAFSDMMATSVEFSFQEPGNRLLRADYLIGEDVITPNGIRSMSDPASFGDPDHYSNRFTGPEDNGGVHINSAIPNHAFYLAIEGGRNRTSGLAVEGVGPGRREEIERVFYRAFTQLLPARAGFSLARAATIQSARDLYGPGSPAERAVTQAWTAVGVE
jgi:Zn-dependent metalloprotease